MLATPKNRVKSVLCRPRRRGVAAVELAFVLPLFVGLALGIVEIGRGFEVSQVLSAAIREGARFAAMDTSGMLLDGQDANAKVTADIRNFLTASGLPGESLTIEIVHADDPTAPFDLGDPANQQEEFRINVSLPFSEVSLLPPFFLKNQSLATYIVFRNSRSTIVQ
jgi:Flp pilus assembly protein TadG